MTPKEWQRQHEARIAALCQEYERRPRGKGRELIRLANATEPELHYWSITQAARENHADVTAVRKACNRGRICAGHLWRWGDGPGECA